MLKPHMVVLLNQKILHGELLSPRPPHDGFRYDDPLLIRERDSQREGFPWSHRQITGESPAGTGEIPDRALALEWTRVVCGGAVHGEAAEGTDRERHRGLAGRRIAGGIFMMAQGSMHD